MDFRTALIEETRAFGDVIHAADPATPVPTCPGWTLRQLSRHVGRGHLWSAQIVAQRRRDALDPRDVQGGKPPDDPDGALSWLTASAQAIPDAVDRVGADARVWTFLGSRPAGWWIRRRLHEVTVHRADAVLALGDDFELSPELCADGVSEWLELATISADRRKPPLRRGQTMHLHATDDGLGPTGEWTVTHDEDGVNWSHDHAKGDVALRGRATDLLLAVTRRRPAADLGLETFGDAGVWEDWLAATPF